MKARLTTAGSHADDDEPKKRVAPDELPERPALPRALGHGGDGPCPGRSWEEHWQDVWAEEEAVPGDLADAEGLDDRLDLPFDEDDAFDGNDDTGSSSRITPASACG